MNSKVDKFIKESKQWREEIRALREVLLKTKLEEDLKWRLPCYTYEGKNVVIIQPFKASLALMFFKGSLLKDSKNILRDVGPNSQSAKRIEFTSLQEINKLSSSIKTYIKEAITLEESGEKFEFKKDPEPLPEELKKKLKEDSKLKKAFESLTPGRKRAYILFISGAKQSKTRESRVEKSIPKILKGKGMHD